MPDEAGRAAGRDMFLVKKWPENGKGAVFSCIMHEGVKHTNESIKNARGTEVGAGRGSGDAEDYVSGEAR
jgi:hypothetical protein